MNDPKYIRHDLDSCMAHMVEECGEVLAALGKSQRWGLDNFNPELPVEQRETNQQWLRREMRDLLDVWARLERHLS